MRSDIVGHLKPSFTVSSKSNFGKETLVSGAWRMKVQSTHGNSLPYPTVTELDLRMWILPEKVLVLLGLGPPL